MKWLRRMLLVAAIFLGVILVSGVVAYFKYEETPAWYVTDPMTEQEQKDAANSADQKLADLFSWVAAVQAHANRTLRGDSSQPPADVETVTLTDRELNSFYDAWQSPAKDDLQDKLGKYFTDGKLVLTDGRIILAGKSRDLGVIISVRLEPSVDDSGRLHLQWNGVSAGELNVPRAAIAGRLNDVNAQLQDRLSRAQQSADVDRTLTGNSAALQASLTHWLLNALNGQIADSTTFVPFDVGSFQNVEAVRLTSVRVGEGSITMSFQPLAPTDRQAVLARLKAPYQSLSDSNALK